MGNMASNGQHNLFPNGNYVGLVIGIMTTIQQHAYNPFERHEHLL